MSVPMDHHKTSMNLPTAHDLSGRALPPSIRSLFSLSPLPSRYGHADMQTRKHAPSQPGRAGLSPLEYCDTSAPSVCTRRRFRPSRSLAPVLMLLRSPDDVPLSYISPRHWAVALSPASMVSREWNRNKSSSQRQMLRRLTCLLPSSSHCLQTPPETDGLDGCLLGIQGPNKPHVRKPHNAQRVSLWSVWSVHLVAQTARQDG